MTPKRSASLSVTQNSEIRQIAILTGVVDAVAHNEIVGNFKADMVDAAFLFQRIGL